MSNPGMTAQPQPSAQATNALSAGQTLPPSGVPAPSARLGPDGQPIDMNDMLNHMTGIHQQASAKYDKLQKAVSQADAFRVQLDSLVKLGDTVTQEDLVQAASKLVGKGVAPAELAGVLSEAPEGAESLRGWIVQQDKMMTANELKLKQIVAVARHDMGVSAMRLIAAHHMAAEHGAGAAGPPPANALMQSGQPPTAGAANDLMPQSDNDSSESQALQ